MKPKILLRAASCLMMLHTLGHSMGALNWKNSQDKTMQGVINAMLANKFLFMGASRSLGDFYEGYGLSMIFVLLMVTFLLWITAGEAATNPKLAAKILLPVLFFLVTLAIVEAVYFFPFAATISSVSVICTGVSLVVLLKQNNLMA